MVHVTGLLIIMIIEVPWFKFQMKRLPNVQFRKKSIPTPWKVIGNSYGEGDLRSQNCKTKNLPLGGVCKFSGTAENKISILIHAQHEITTNTIVTFHLAYESNYYNSFVPIGQ